MENSNVILIIGLVWPEPKSSAAGTRMMQLIELFQNWNYKIIFASTASENDLNFDLSLLGIEKVSIKLNDATFDIFIKERLPKMVVFDRFVTEEQFGWRVTEHCPDALKILDSEDLHCLRYTRGADLKKGIPFEVEHLFNDDGTKREIASILRCDLTLVIAEYEMELLSNQFKIDKKFLFYLPILFKVENSLIEKSAIDFCFRKNFVFIGNFWHEPNWDTVVYLKKNIWPLIRKMLPKANLKIYGSYSNQKVFDLHNPKEGFLVFGRAEDAKKVISEAKVLLAPIRFGAGLKGKLLEAMEVGTPSVTSSIGAESINGPLNWNGFIVDDPNKFANKAVLLYENEQEWLDSQKNGFAILKERFSWNHFEIILKSRLLDLIENLVVHRQSNFYGALLLHHTMKSTEYMARWIEEKNKNALLTKL